MLMVEFSFMPTKGAFLKFQPIQIALSLLKLNQRYINTFIFCTQNGVVNASAFASSTSQLINLPDATS